MSSIPSDHHPKEEASKAPIQAKLEALRAKEDAAYAKLHASLQTQIDTATAEITQLEARLAIATGKAKTQMKVRLEGLRAKRDAAYEKLHASLQAQIDSITAELKAREGREEKDTGTIKAQLAERLEALKAKRDAAQQYRATGASTQHPPETAHAQ